MSGLDNTSETYRVAAGTTDTVTLNDYDIAYTNVAAKAVTLFAASAVQPGRTYTFINTAANAVTITPASGTIDGQATQTVAAGAAGAYHSRTLVSDGISNWLTKAAA